MGQHRGAVRLLPVPAGYPMINPLDSIPEKDLGTSVEQLCVALGLRYYHTWNSRHSVGGFPDYVIVGPTRVIYAELKRQKGKVTKEQQEWLEDLERAGQLTYVWRPGDMAAIVSTLKSLKKGNL